MATYSFTLADSAPVSISRGFVDPGDTVTKSVGGSSGTVTYDPDTSFLAGPRLNVSSTAGLPRDANAGAGLSEIVTIFLRSSTAPDVAPALTGLPVTVRVSATLKADATAGQAGLALGSANATARVTIDKATDIIGEARAFDGPNPQPTQTPNDLVNFRSDEVLDGPFPFLRVILATGSVATSYGGSGEASIRTDFKIAKLSLKVGGQTVNTDQLFYLESTSPGIGDSNPAQSAGTNGDDVLSSRKGKDDGLFGLFGDDLFIADAGADIF
jgi:hypothetical protein